MARDRGRGRGRRGGEEASATAKTPSLASRVEVSEEMIKRLERDLRRNTFTVLTPYTLAQAYGLRISAAKKILREAASRGILELYSGGRTPIYVKPRGKS